MKYKTQITEIKEVEVDVNLSLLLARVLQDTLIKIPLVKEKYYTYTYAFVSEDCEVHQSQVKEGYTGGHYDQEDTMVSKCITNDIDKGLLAKVQTFYKAIKYLKEDENVHKD
tara:strand:+ start:6185 stop:6520 length:336 start_codon:yes stop_codon:yes gene_type:complete